MLFVASASPGLGQAREVVISTKTDVRDVLQRMESHRLDRARFRRVLLQSQVRPAPMIVVHETLQVTVQTPFAEHDYVVQALAANGADDPFDISSLPGRPRCRQHLFDPHGFQLIHEIFPEDPVAISQQIAGRGVPRKGFAELLRGPLRSGMSGYGKVENPAAVVRQHQKHIQDLESNGRHRKEVHRNHGLNVIFEESQPSLRWWLAEADHILADARLADGDAKLEQFAVNSRCTPERVVAAHRTYQGSDVHWDCWSSQLSKSNLPYPEQAEALAMPTDHLRPQSRHRDRRMRLLCSDDGDVSHPLRLRADGSGKPPHSPSQCDRPSDGGVDPAAVPGNSARRPSYRFVLHDRDSIFSSWRPQTAAKLIPEMKRLRKDGLSKLLVPV